MGRNSEAERQSMAVENKVLTRLRFHTLKNLHQQLVMSCEGDQKMDIGYEIKKTQDKGIDFYST